MAFCPRCNFEIEQSAIECSRCHADFTKPGGWHSLAKNQYEPVPHPPLYSRYWTIGNALLAFLFIAWVAGYLFYLRPLVFDYLLPVRQGIWNESLRWLFYYPHELDLIPVFLLPILIWWGIIQIVKIINRRDGAQAP